MYLSLFCSSLTHPLNAMLLHHLHKLLLAQTSAAPLLHSKAVVLPSLVLHLSALFGLQQQQQLYYNCQAGAAQPQQSQEHASLPSSSSSSQWARPPSSYSMAQRHFSSESSAGPTSSRRRRRRQCGGIRAADSPQKLLEVLQQTPAADLDVPTIRAAFEQAAELCHGGSNSNSSSEEPAAVRELLQLLQQLGSQLGEQQQQQKQLGSRDLAAIMQACGVLGLPAVVELLLPQLLQQDMLQEASTQDVSHAVMGAARSGAVLQDSQLQQLLSAFCAHPAAPGPRAISRLLRAVADMRQRVPAQQLQDLMQQLTAEESLAAATPHDISSSLLAAASMGHAAPEEQLRLLLPVFVQQLRTASAKDIQELLWAIAGTGKQLPSLQQQLLWDILHQFRQLLPSAQPIHISRLLWAVAKLQQRWNESKGLNPLSPDNSSVSEKFLSTCVTQLLSKWAGVTGYDVALTLWACSHMRFHPQKLLDTVHQSCQDPAFLQTLQDGGPRTLASISYACAQMRFHTKRLPGVLLQLAVQELNSSSHEHSSSSSHGNTNSNSHGSSSSSRKPALPGSKLGGRPLANMCWAAAVLNLHGHREDVLQLAAACGADWGTMGPENMLQLFQVHLWLQDCAQVDRQREGDSQPAGSGLVAAAGSSSSNSSSSDVGLAGVLEPQQLEECRSSWLRQVQEVITAGTRASKRQRVVFALLDELPLQWQQAPALAQPTADGCFSIDIAAVTAKGTRLAIEVDGPGHYLRPGYRRDGPTEARNRALRARGYVVISIPYFEWRRLNTEQQRRYLLSKVLASD